MKAAARTENREFTAMDLLPTVLAAMGFQIEGDRLVFLLLPEAFRLIVSVVLHKSPPIPGNLPKTLF